MDNNNNNNNNNSGIYTTVQTIETKPDDGFVHEADINPVDSDNYGKYHKGYTKTSIITSNDPRITRPIIYGVCAIFLAIGVISLLSGNWFFGIIFTFSSIITFFKLKSDVDKIEQQLKTNVNYDNSTEKQQEVQKEFLENINNEWADIKEGALTKNNFKSFTKKFLPIYFIITFLIFLLLTFAVNLIFGIIILIILIASGLLYYWVFSKIFNK